MVIMVVPPGGWLIDPNEEGKFEYADHVVVLGGPLGGENWMVVSAAGDYVLILLIHREPALLRKVRMPNLVLLVERPASESDKVVAVDYS
jgi:hypothetical protein